MNKSRAGAPGRCAWLATLAVFAAFVIPGGFILLGAWAAARRG